VQKDKDFITRSSCSASQPDIILDFSRSSQPERVELFRSVHVVVRM